MLVPCPFSGDAAPAAAVPCRTAPGERALVNVGQEKGSCPATSTGLDDALGYEAYEEIKETLMHELGVHSPTELLPLIAGSLRHLVEEDCKSSGHARPRRRGAFSRAVSTPNTEFEDVSEEDLWRCTLRAAFSVDTALTAQQRLLKAYTSEPFASELEELRASWRAEGSAVPEDQQSQEVYDLCFRRVVQNLLPQFGFDRDPKSHAQLQACIDAHLSHEIVAAQDQELREVLSVTGRYGPSPLAPPDQVDAGSLAVAAAAAFSAEGLQPEHFASDAEVQAQVLAALGISWYGEDGQRPLPQDELVHSMDSNYIAQSLLGRNSFDSCYLPMLQAMTSSGDWPLVLLGRPQAYVCELPTLELCAAICTRILCAARRLQAAGASRLLFLGVGSGDALVEACVALHLGRILGQEVELQGRQSLSSLTPLTFRYRKGFQIVFVVSDTTNIAKRRASQTLEAREQMEVFPYDFYDAVRDFAANDVPLYVFSCWPPEGEVWRKGIEEAAGKWLAELCFVQPPAPLHQTSEADMQSSRFRTTELFPKTLCCQDFLAQDFAGGLVAGLHHSQLYVLTPRDVAPPFLAQQLTHQLGPYHLRMQADRRLRGVNVFRRVGFSFACSPADLANPLPDMVLSALQESLYGSYTSSEISELCSQLREAMAYAEGDCRSQLELLVRNATQRIQGPNMAVPSSPAKSALGSRVAHARGP